MSKYLIRYASLIALFASLVLMMALPKNTQAAPTVATPTSQSWYFAEGRVGGGFRTWLTIGNPNSSDCSVNIQYNFTLDRGGSSVKQVGPIHVDRMSRWTEYVNNDLNITQFNINGANVSSIVSTSDCTGITVERPMYFSNFHKTSSGSDVFGATTPEQDWYFAEVPRGTSGESFISVLNPNTTNANVTVYYYVGGTTPLAEKKTIAAQSTDRFFPDGFNVDRTDLAVLVHSDIPIVAERPSYYSNVNGVSGASDVMGVLAPSPQWVLPAGSTDNGNHETLYVANPSGTPVVAVVQILSTSGIAHTIFDGVIATNDQHFVDINTENSFTGSSSDNSLVVTGFTNEGKTTLTNIIVQRVMYDNDYTGHNANTPDWNESGVAASPGIASQGQITGEGVVSFTLPTTYSFAEGFVSANFNEFIDVTNPTNQPESVSIQLINMLGETDTGTIPVPAFSRQTFDVTNFVENSHTFTLTNVKAYAVSAIVSGDGPFGVEREMHWNAFSTDGISTVPGFAGPAQTN